MHAVSKGIVAGAVAVVVGGMVCGAALQSATRTGRPAAPPASAAQSRKPAIKPAVAPGVTVSRADYLAYARASADYTWDHREEILARWRETFDPASPFGYRAPGGLLDIATIYSVLYELERNPVHAERTKQILLTYGDYRARFPESAAKARPDYSNGVPALPDFFVVMRYLRAYDTLHRLNQLTAAEAATSE